MKTKLTVTFSVEVDHDTEESLASFKQHMEGSYCYSREAYCRGDVCTAQMVKGSLRVRDKDETWTAKEGSEVVAISETITALCSRIQDECRQIRLTLG